jgi:hypothetical protein
MKAVKIMLTIAFVSLLVYFVSCNVIDTPVSNNGANNNNNGDNVLSCTGNCIPPDYCCTNHCMAHFCLYISYNDEYVSLEDVASIRVSHLGNDCQGNSYSCTYQLINPGGNPTGAGCILPNGTNVEMTRSVCGTMHDGRRFVGSLTFHPHYDGCIVPIRFLSRYEVSQCDEIPD